MHKIWLSPPHIGKSEKLYIDEAFASNWISPLGANVDQFENQLKKYLGVNSVVALSSGTAAIHLALKILGVKENDVVICQSFTFAASAFPVLYCNAVPVFIDSEAKTWNMDPELMEAAIKSSIKMGKKPAAIIVVHLYGVPAKMNDIMEIANRYDIPVIEDAAEALGSIYCGQPCGSIGHIGILSFNGNKIITTSGGGALISNNKKIEQEARYLSAQALVPAPYYLHEETGYNYRLSNVLAGIGRGQMEVLPDRVKRRREIFEYYKQAFLQIDGIDFLDEPVDCFSNRWLSTILFDKEKMGNGTAEIVRGHLEMNNIESRRLWKPLHQQPVFAGYKYYNGNISDTLFENGLCLPSGTALSMEQLEKIVFEVQNCIHEFA